VATEFLMLDDNHQITFTEDLIEWARWTSDIQNRRVALDTVGDVEVSTVFMMVAALPNYGPPFETLVTDGGNGCLTRRYATWDEAAAAHQRIVESLRAGKPVEEAFNA
jgi:hypothetical protein